MQSRQTIGELLPIGWLATPSFDDDTADDAQLSAEARRILRALIRTRPENTLALADLAARGSTPKARVPAVLHELETRGHLMRWARIAPHLSAALPPSATSTLAGTPTVEPADRETA